MNDHFKSIIASYLSRTTDYALLVDGPWGSGKTFQVKKALQASHKNHLYMSAAGGFSSDDLGFRLLVASTPFIGSKFAKVAEHLVSGLLSRAKIDYKLKLSDFAKVPNDAVIVIDDVERFVGPLSTLLAFSNDLVERGSRKVILLAAENEISDDQKPIFLRTKEKVVGQHVRIVPDVDGLIKGILYRVPSEYQTFLTESGESIKLVFDRLGKGNLRTLKRFLFDFLPIHDGLSMDAGLETSRIAFVAQTLLGYTLAARRNDIDKALLQMRPDDSATAAFIEQSGSRPELKALLDVGKAIPEIDIYDQRIADDFISAFVFDGFVESQLIERTKNDLMIAGGRSAAEPWRVLWRYIDIDDATFSQALSSFLDQFFRREFIAVGEVIHAFGILFELSDAGLIKYSQDQVTEMVEAYADEITNRSEFDLTLGGDFADHRHGSSYGLGFHQLKNPKMGEAIAHLKQAAEAKRQAQLVKRFEDAFQPTSGRRPTDAIEIMVGSDPRNSLHGVPFLHKIDAGNLAARLINQSAEIQGSVLRAIPGRFSQEDRAVTDIEGPWVAQLARALENRANGTKSDLVKRRVSQMLDWYLRPLISVEAGSKQ